MSIFDLRGPAFLAFYACFALLMYLLMVALRRFMEAGEAPRVPFEDPFMFAYLRGGMNEVLRIAVVSLVDRGLLNASGEEVEMKPGAETSARRTLEKSVLSFFKTSRPASDMFSKAVADFSSHDEKYRTELESLHLLPSAGDRARRWMLKLGICSILAVVAGVKFNFAFNRGKTNVQFLFVLAGVALALVLYNNPRRTQRGDSFMADMRTLFKGLKDRAAGIRRGGDSSDAVLLACIFGVGALPGTTFSFVQTLFPKAKSGGCSSCGSSWSTSCGSSCGSSCSSSCGGGGCGGGCGGCGG